jgi:uncharacterized Zn-binding protein involved in type VI secretion
MWRALTGSNTVFISGAQAHRIGDTTLHCEVGTGQLIEGSSDVIIGG